MCQPCAMLELWFFMTVITQDVPTVTTGQQCIEIMGCFVQASRTSFVLVERGCKCHFSTFSPKMGDRRERQALMAGW